MAKNGGGTRTKSIEKSNFVHRMIDHHLKLYFCHIVITIREEVVNLKFNCVNVVHQENDNKATHQFSQFNFSRLVKTKE